MSTVLAKEEKWHSTKFLTPVQYLWYFFHAQTELQYCVVGSPLVFFLTEYVGLKILDDLAISARFEKKLVRESHCLVRKEQLSSSF
jgi:hypothetical protein